MKPKHVDGFSTPAEVLDECRTLGGLVDAAERNEKNNDKRRNA